MLAFIRQYRKGQGDNIYMYISSGIKTEKKTKQTKRVECMKSRKLLEIGDEAVPNRTNIKAQILVEIWELPDVQCFFYSSFVKFFSCPITTLSSQLIWWSSSQVCCATPDLCISPLWQFLWCSVSLVHNVLLVSPMYDLSQSLQGMQ